MIKKAKVPLFDAFVVHFCDDAQEMLDWAAKKRLQLDGPTDDYSACGGMVFSDGGQDLMMFVAPGQGGRVVAHESVHVAYHVCKMAGVPPTYKSQEVVAHLTDWAFGQFCSRIIGPQVESQA